MEAIQLVQQLAQNEAVKSNLLKIINAYQELDYHLLNDFLDEDCLYQDMRKTSFILKQKRIFDALKKRGDTQLLLSTDICSGCLCSAPIFVFTGNQSGFKYALYFEFKGDTITDIFRCGLNSSIMGKDMQL